MKRSVFGAATALVVSGCLNLAAPERGVFVPPYAAQGCWVNLYAESSFGGAARRLEGPTQVEALEGWLAVVPGIEQTAPQPVFSAVRSLALGPNARLTGYEDTLFRGKALSLAPGSEVRDAATVDFPRRVRSFRVDCAA